MKQSKPAGFWKRILARGIDFFFVSLISVGLLFIINDHASHSISTFKEPWKFYFWSIVTIMAIFLFMIAIPLATKGRSIGMYIVKIKVIALKGNVYMAIVKREVFYGFAWIFVSCLTMSIINHTLINSAANIKGFQDPNINLTSWQKTRITLCGSISGLIGLIQMWLAITIIPSKSKQGWHDKYAESQVINVSKYINIKVEQKTKIIQPQIIKQEKVEWIK